MLRLKSVLNRFCVGLMVRRLVSWYRYYALVIAVHALEVVIVGSAAALMILIRPAYETKDVLVMIAVGMVAGAIYIMSMTRLVRHERKQPKDT